MAKYNKSEAETKMSMAVPDALYGRMKPSLSLTESDLPAVKNWVVGKTYKLELTVKQVGSNIDSYSDKKNISARFEILKVTEGTTKGEKNE